MTEEQLAAYVDARVGALEQQLTATLEVTRAMASALLAEKQRSAQLEMAVKELMGDLPQQVVEKQFSPLVRGDTAFNLNDFSQWATEAVKAHQQAQSVPEGLKTFTTFVTGQGKERVIPRS